MKKKNENKFDFLGLAKFFTSLSVVLVIASIFLFFTKGFNWGIDFAGGTEIQVQFSQIVDPANMRSFTDKMGLKSVSVQAFPETNEFLIRFDSEAGKDDKETNQKQLALLKKITEGLNTEFSDKTPEVRRVDSVGPQVGNELKRNGMLAIFYGMLVILIYMGFRFDYAYAVPAVICLFHDVIITMGIASLFGREVNVQTLAAVMTIIGYSLNDTIVIFDRIREMRINFIDSSFYDSVNKALNEMLSRTILTSLATLFSIIFMVFYADSVIQDFAYTMTLGIIIGSYSTIYIASPLAVVMHKWSYKKKSLVKAKAATI